jgi:hypothetical protein
MTRPSIVRADTIDLQDHNAPSAAKHSNAPSNPSLAPHQAETLREVAQLTAVEESRSPHLSWTNDNGTDDRDLHQYAQDLTAGVNGSIHGGAMQNKDEEDALAVAQNGGVSSSDEGDMDGDGDGDLDDDMMDKISSSPSIEDGAFSSTEPSTAHPHWKISFHPRVGSHRLFESGPSGSVSPTPKPLRSHDTSLPPPAAGAADTPTGLCRHLLHCKYTELESEADVNHGIDHTYVRLCNDDGEAQDEAAAAASTATTLLDLRSDTTSNWE